MRDTSYVIVVEKNERDLTRDRSGKNCERYLIRDRSGKNERHLIRDSYGKK